MAEPDGSRRPVTAGQRVATGQSLAASRRPVAAVAVLFAIATVAAEVAYPLVRGDARARLTVLTVVAFFLASVTHATATRGARWAAALVVITAGGGLLAEAVGVATGVPFGHYSYGPSLGRQVFGVPLVIPLAWTMMAYPARVVGRVCAGGAAGRVVVGAVALASWDVFLDPQMTDAGHWRFTADNGPTLTGIPLVNYAGWLLVAVLLMSALELLLPAEPDRPTPAADAVPLGLYLWTYASSLLANLAFFHRPDVALTGGVVMGVPVALLVWSLRSRTATRT
jgi:putative membrane protein